MLFYVYILFLFFLFLYTSYFALTPPSHEVFVMDGGMRNTQRNFMNSYHQSWGHRKLLDGPADVILELPRHWLSL